MVVGLDDFLADRVSSRGNIYDSVVFDLLKTADTFGMLDEVINMVYWKNANTLSSRFF